MAQQPQHHRAKKYCEEMEEQGRNAKTEGNDKGYRRKK